MNPLHLPCLFLASTALPAALAQNVAGHSNPNGFASEPFGIYTLFAANDQIVGMELWRYDHSTQATTRMADIASGSPGSHPRGITRWSGGYVFAASDGSNGVELWKCDAAGGAVTLIDINTFAGGSSFPHSFVAVGNRVFFVASNGSSGEELFVYDGTAATLVKDIVVGAGGSEPRSLVAFGNEVLFSADDGSNGRELWHSDGLPAGTSMVKDINLVPAGAGTAGSGPTELLSIGGSVLFAADDGLAGTELWRTDGTLGGTSMVMDIQPGADGSYPSAMTIAGNVFFAATTAASGRELWKTAGTAGTTSQVADINAGIGSSDPSDIIYANLFEVWFTAYDNTYGRELHRVLMSGAGWTRKTDILPLAGTVLPRNLMQCNGRIVFTDGIESHSLYVVDNSPAGASVVKTFRSGPSALTRTVSIVGGPQVLFAADDDIIGTEPWRTDGTLLGTAPLADIAQVGPAGSSYPNLDVHVDTGGTVVTICLEKGDPNFLGLIGIDVAPGTPISLPGILDGLLLISPFANLNLVVLDAAGTGCITVTIPGTITAAELVAQGFALTSPTVLPARASDLASFGITSAAITPFPGGQAKTVGTFSDQDHRYEISVQLPTPTSSSGKHKPGTFVLRHRIGEGNESYLQDLEEHQFPYDGTELELFFTGETPLEKIKGLELWFVDSGGESWFMWKSYC